ncbi:Pigment-dispersing hormone peptide [Frankliniella fusca]|uniref:Pigment-dispersing hormone peptide n=1 Tax=Frankliniella fusca TaxID=407009 RepID=A0AAE1H322_9NEOP|nr:Pigment-dispersing hormone peptide [Frankliniella fusca]
MRSSALSLVLVLSLWSALELEPCSAAPRYDDDAKGLAGLTERDVQLWRDVVLQTLQQAVRAANDDFGPIYHHKRNSEILTSLLGITPKIAAAGRK